MIYDSLTCDRHGRVIVKTTKVKNSMCSHPLFLNKIHENVRSPEYYGFSDILVRQQKTKRRVDIFNKDVWK